MNRIFLAVLIVIFGLGVTAFIRLSAPNVDNSSSNPDEDGFLKGIFDDNGGDRDDDESDDDSQNNALNTGNNAVTGNVISSSLLSQHNTKDDCWVAYGGKVYDVTSFLPKHPGSAGAIIPYCGTYDEFVKAFEGQHGKSKVANLMKVGALMGDFQIQGKI